MHFTRAQRDDWNAFTKESSFNRWLRDQVNHADGTLDLDRLHALAAQYGIDARARYGHLNPGQQRMNVGNRLRSLVPQEMYAGLGSDAAPAKKPVSSPPVSSAPRPLISTPTVELMASYGQILDELLQRKVIRTRNSPVGDYAEHLFAKCFGWKLQANSTSGYDATDETGIRYQVKCRRAGPSVSGARQLSVFRGLPDAKFDVLAGMLFDEQFSVERAALIPHHVVLERSKYVQHVNGWRFSLDDAVWSLAGVSDVTEQIKSVEKGRE